jgi:cobaltochelatase CobT
MSEGAGNGDMLGAFGDYSVFATGFDRVTPGAELAPLERRRSLRAELDQLAAAQAVSAPGLARRLLTLFGTPAEDDWSFGVDHGTLDGRRLAQLVANPSQREVFRRRRLQRLADTAVTFLVDNSGSMKRQRYEAISVLVDTFSRALDLAGITNEVIGFTTGAWSGGRPLAEWTAAGSPAEPGRLNEVQYVVYKDADTSWRRARSSLSAMLSTHHFRESVDGEAVAWAHDRLVVRPERRRALVVVSDGAPNDSATSSANREGFLEDHLHAVTAAIEARQRSGAPGAVELAAIGVDLDVSAVYRRSVDLDLSGTLGLPHYRALETLFGM